MMIATVNQVSFSPDTTTGIDFVVLA
jgi:hypothetical protein